ncbi:hypothetical protein K474DRAFT_458742 [Panus rudis PR-1116 ss-1]|nr:hypothetical protein K474DRAFT_458742 [Panus rudis PR-1116 ss-1]
MMQTRQMIDARRDLPQNPPPPPLIPASFGPPPRIAAIPYELNMPHRVEAERTSSRRTDDRTYDQPSPPPIATLHHSPAVSVSSVPSPSPPVRYSAMPIYTATHSHFLYPQLHAPPQPYYAHPHSMPHPQYSYQPPPPPPGRYADGSMAAAHPMSQPPAYVPTQSTYPGQATYIIHTDDAATKLSDRVRRKCYNCRTTDTSTWRRSSLTPGKVLCNKCGLFERTHSRPRPEQFPHKRGPVVTTSFKSTRTPPPSGSQSRLPSISSSSSQSQMQPLPPHQYDHPSIAPLMNRSDSQNSQQSSSNGSSGSNNNNNNNGTAPELRNILNNGAPGSPQGHHQNGGVLSVSGKNEHHHSTPKTSPKQSPRMDQHQHRSPPHAQENVNGASSS